MLSSEQRSQRARIAAYARASRYDGLVVTAAARAAGDQRFVTQAAAEAAERGEQVSERELQRRALALRKLFYARIAFRSAKVRAARKNTKPEAATSPTAASGSDSLREVIAAHDGSASRT